MRRIRKLLGLSPTERRLLVTAAVVLVGVRFGLSLLSFQTMRPILRWMLQRSKRPTQSYRPSIDRIVWAVEVASRHTPRTQTCLVKALTAQGLFDRYNYSTDLRIGVARNEDELMEAHSWIERDGAVVIGDLEDLSRYTPFPPFEGGHR